jgi:ureidoacrylate peracid hydrolase
MTTLTQKKTAAQAGDIETLSFARPRPPQRLVSFPATPSAVEIDLNRTALIVIDMQNDFCDPEGWLPKRGTELSPTRAIIPVINHLTVALRTASIPVIWLNWGVRADRANLARTLIAKSSNLGREPTYADPSPSGRGHVLVRDEWGAEVIDDLTVGKDDRLVYKHRFSGFWDNELDSILRKDDITTLLFAGVNTDRCVLATLQDAGFLGYDCILLDDATATSSPSFVREAVLFLVRLLHGVVAQSTELLEAL